MNIRTPGGLTSLGQYAVKAMMKQGMIIDIDHMSNAAVETTLQIAEGVTRGVVGGGYPIMSGHRAFGTSRISTRRIRGRLSNLRESRALEVCWGSAPTEPKPETGRVSTPGVRLHERRLLATEYFSDSGRLRECVARARHGRFRHRHELPSQNSQADNG